MNEQEKITHAFELACRGEFGTPEKPIRNSGPKGVFWAVYFGHRNASEYRRNFSYPWAKAGEMYRAHVEQPMRRDAPDPGETA